MLDQQLVDAAKQFVSDRYPETGWAGAAAIYTENKKILLGTSPPALNEAVNLCHETGAILEAYKLEEKVAACVCVLRDPQANFHILTPCGVCQERLIFWGNHIEVAVPMPNDSTQWQVKTLKEVQPFYWRLPLLDL